jgi:hypothetical protein
MFWMLLVLGCSDLDKDQEDTNQNQNQNQNQNDTDTDDDTAIDTGQQDTDEPLVPFVPAQGHWTYSGGTLLPSGTNCVIGEEEQNMTDPVGFTLAVVDDTFRVIADGTGNDVVTCLLADVTSTEPGSFSCDPTSTNILIEDIFEDDLGQTADIELNILTNSVGGFNSTESLTMLFTLSITCLDFDYWAGGDCTTLNDDNDGDGNADYPTPCTIQFNAEATLDAGQ